MMDDEAKRREAHISVPGQGSIDSYEEGDETRQRVLLPGNGAFSPLPDLLNYEKYITWAPLLGLYQQRKGWDTGQLADMLGCGVMGLHKLGLMRIPPDGFAGVDESYLALARAYTGIWNAALLRGLLEAASTPPAQSANRAIPTIPARLQIEGKPTDDE